MLHTYILYRNCVYIFVFKCICQFRIHKTFIGKLIPQVCDVIYQALNEKYLKIPSTKEEWEKIAEKAKER